MDDGARQPSVTGPRSAGRRPRAAIAPTDAEREPHVYRTPVGDRPRVQRAQHRGRDPPPHAGRGPAPMQLEVVVVDDGSTDGTDKVLVGPAGLDRARRHPRRQPGQGRRRAHRARDAPGASSSSSRTPTSSTTPTTGPGCSTPSSRARPRSSTGAASPASGKNMRPIALAGQPPADPDRQRPVPLDAVGHGDVLQALRPARPRRHHHRVRRLRLRARDHGQGPAPRATGSTRSRSPTPGATPRRGTSSSGATACVPSRPRPLPVHPPDLTARGATEDPGTGRAAPEVVDRRRPRGPSVGRAAGRRPWW